MAAIQTKNLTKHFGDVRAVRGIDIDVEHGSIHGFVGPNGAGKTTTMEMLVGLVTPTVGEAYIDGHPAGSREALETIGFAPQEPVFYNSMSARAYLQYIGNISDIDGDTTTRVEEILEWLGLDEAAGQAISGFSGGMKRRLGLAQAMIHDPELLILDEPTAELDPQGRVRIIEALEALTDDGKTVFVSSHILAELEQFIESVTVIDDGQVVTSGPLEEVRSGVVEAFTVKSTDDAALHSVLEHQDWITGVASDEGPGVTVHVSDQERFQHDLPRLLNKQDLGIRSLQRRDGLEDAFLDIVTKDEGE